MNPCAQSPGSPAVARTPAGRRATPCAQVPVGHPHSLLDRIMNLASPEPNSGCWLWTGELNQKGYGRIKITVGAKRQTRVVHRVAYELLVGPVPEGLVLDHLCRVRCCVNPAHLEPVTSAENTRRGVGVGRCGRSASNTHCPAGHEYVVENLYVRPNGYRECRTCRREKVKKYNKPGLKHQKTEFSLVLAQEHNSTPDQRIWSGVLS